MRHKPESICHYSDVMMSEMASQIIGVVTIVYSTVCSGEDQRKYQRSASLAFVRGIHRWPVNSPHKWPVTRNMFPFDGPCNQPCVCPRFRLINRNKNLSDAMMLKSTKLKHDLVSILTFWVIHSHGITQNAKQNKSTIENWPHDKQRPGSSITNIY